MQNKRLDKKDKIIVKIYHVKTWLTKKYNAYIVQYLTK